MLALALAGAPQESPADRAGLIAALDRRAATGVPRHLDHDEGELLQAAVADALARDPGDTDVAVAAARASWAFVPRVGPPIGEGTPAVGLDMLPPFSLPWKTSVAGTIDVSLDGSSWRRAANFTSPGTDVPIPLATLFPKAAGRAGFHTLRFRLSLRVAGLPGASPLVDTRDLPAVSYGVVGTSAAGQRVAAFMRNAAGVSAFDLDHALPGVPLHAWLNSIAPPGEAPSPMWGSRWCEVRERMDEQPFDDVCAVAMVGAAPGGAHGEVWIQVAKVDTSGDKPVWTAVSPTLAGVDIGPSHAATTSLAELPFALRSEDDTPRADMSFDAAAITLSPAQPRPGQVVAIRATVKNTGRADLLGMTIDVLAFDTPERMLLHRRFVRSILAGESVSVEVSAPFPLGYGGVEVSVLPLTDHTMMTPLMADGSDGFRHAARLVRPELAPRGYVERVRASVVCNKGCTNVR